MSPWISKSDRKSGGGVNLEFLKNLCVWPRGAPLGPVSIYPKDVFEMVADRNAASSLAPVYMCMGVCVCWVVGVRYVWVCRFVIILVCVCLGVHTQTNAGCL